MPTPFALEAYLNRVGLDHAPTTDEKGLRALHDAQFFSIPFENFDIQLGRGIRLDTASLVDKLVHRRRGGYCFELNGLMQLALEHLDFQVRPLLARVHLGAGPSGRSHQLSLVQLQGRPWIIDVGFGAGGLRCPLPLDTDRDETGPGWGFRFREMEGWGYVMQSLENGEWKNSYTFDLLTVGPADIAMGNYFTSTNPDNKFVIHRIASRPLPDGRVSLLDETMTRIEAGEKTTRPAARGPEFIRDLADTFAIELDAGYEELRPLEADSG